MFDKYFKALDSISPFKRYGKVLNASGLIIEANCPGTYLGEICEISPQFGKDKVLAEVVSIKSNNILLMPYQPVTGVSQGSLVSATGKTSVAKVGNSLLGRVVDAFGNAIDGEGELNFLTEVAIHNEPIKPLSRKAITTPVETGVKAIDAFITIGQGQKIGLFAGSGVGKSTLLNTICHNTTEDINVIALIGERGREVEEFVSAMKRSEKMKNTIVICATAEQPPLIRAHAVYTSLAIAEYFSNEGCSVLFTMDSVTRFAMALREIGLAVGEPPTVKGYTPSVFSELPAVLERCGNFKQRGPITGIFNVLVESDDFNDPIVDCVRAILDGHIVLTRELAEKAHYPAIEILKSTSRLFNVVNNKEQVDLAIKARKAAAIYFENKELIELGGLAGNAEHSEGIVEKWLGLAEFLQQSNESPQSIQKTRSDLGNLVGKW